MRFNTDKGRITLLQTPCLGLMGLKYYTIHMAMSVLDCDLMKDIQEGYNQDREIAEIIEKLKREPGSKKHYF